MIHGGGGLCLPSPQFTKFLPVAVKNLFSWLRMERGEIRRVGCLEGQKKGVLAPCSLWDGLSQVAFVCQPPRTNKSSTRLKPGWLMVSWEKRYATMFIFPVQSFLFRSLLQAESLLLDWGRCSPRIHSKPRRPAVLSFLADCGTGKRPPDDCGLCAVQGSGSATESFRLTFIHTAKRGASCRTQEPPTSKTPIELLTGSEPMLYLDFCLVVFLVGWEKAAFSMRMQW